MNNTPQSPVVSVVSPMYNEAAKIAEAVHSMRTSLESLGVPWEFILVNDGSADNSLTLAREAAGDDPRIRLITYERNRGRGYALRQGFAAASGAFIVATEADLSWGTDIVHRLYQACSTLGIDMVVASPHAQGGRLENVPPYRVFLTQFGNVLLRRLMPGGLTMYTGMTRAYRRQVLEAMDLESDGKELHLEIISKAYTLGFTMGEIPAVLAWSPERRLEKRRFRAGGLILSHLLHGLGESPMTACSPLALAGLIFGLCAFLGFAILRIMGIAGPQTLLLLILAVLGLSGGFQMLLLGYVASQLRDVRRMGYHLQQRQMELLRRIKAGCPDDATRK
jgi:cellulose synthase/poly-beta-1,6-N-acetylglucosamine synthase-like glycosyltransferase